MAAFVCMRKGCWLKDLQDVSEEELEIQYELIMAELTAKAPKKEKSRV